jgi:hypothetical protein
MPGRCLAVLLFWPRPRSCGAIYGDVDINRYIINNFDLDLLDRIVQKHYYHDASSKKYLDIIIKYFHQETICTDDVTKLEMINYEPNINLFYYIPIIIYIVEDYIKKLLKK